MTSKQWARPRRVPLGNRQTRSSPGWSVTCLLWVGLGTKPETPLVASNEPQARMRMFRSR